MIIKVILASMLITSLWGDSTEDKFLVIDSKTYTKIEKLNVLNGGIKTNYVIFSKLVDNDAMQEKYPEIFAYNGQKCFSIQSVYVNKTNKKASNSKKEIEKLKMLNLLHNTSSDYMSNLNLNINTIQAVGIICENKLHIRSKDYKIGDSIDKYYLKSINSKKSNIVLGIK